MMRIKFGGKLIFSGEYSLLHGGSGVAACFDEGIHFNISPMADSSHEAKVLSDKFGECSFNLETPVKKEFELFRQTLNILGLKNVFIEVSSTSTFHGGFGTSGACVASLCCFQLFHGKTAAEGWRQMLLEKAVGVVRQISPHSSGMDLASEIYGGVVHFDPHTLRVEPLDALFLSRFKIIAVDCGYKTSTAECLRVIAKTHPLQAQQEIIREILTCTHKVRDAFIEKDFHRFEDAMNENNDLLIRLGVSDSNMINIMETLKKKGARIVKISGSGLGDCILGFFERDLPLTFHEFRWKEIELDRTGVVFHED